MANDALQTTTGQSVSDNDFDDDEDDAAGISRTRLRIDQARSRFLPADVDASDVDFSDRVNGKRKSYKTSSRRQRALEDGTQIELGDLSDEDDAESLARKIARLRREVEEAREEYGKQRAAAEKKQPDEAAAQDLELDSLSLVLSEISKLPDGSAAHHTTRSISALPGEKASTQQVPVTGDSATYTVTYAASYEQSHALAKAADFDRRLVLLEKSIGIGSSTMLEADSNGLPRAIMPTLETLQKQVWTLSDTSTASLDTISRRVRALIQEAEQLDKARKSAKAAQDALASAGGAAPVEGEDSEQTAKINALYGTLPTIENLTPLLPPLLDRLRSLRAIHADAATASDFLDRIEKQQSEMATDIKQWREGLGKIEEAIKSGEQTMGGNMKIMEGWVKDLEQKIAKLS